MRKITSLTISLSFVGLSIYLIVQGYINTPAFATLCAFSIFSGLSIVNYDLGLQKRVEWKRIERALRLKEGSPTTMPRLTEPVMNMLWESYRTSREESMVAQQSIQRVVSWSMAVGAAIITGLTFLKSLNHPSPLLMAIVGWLVIAILGLLSATQYLGEVGRMLRAGYYARQIERILCHQMELDECSSRLMWEGFLSQRGRRLHRSYRFGALASFGGVIISQVAPFLIFDSPWYLSTMAFIAAIASLGLAYSIGDNYMKRFPSEDAEDSDPIQSLLQES